MGFRTLLRAGCLLGQLVLLKGRCFYLAETQICSRSCSGEEGDAKVSPGRGRALEWGFSNFIASSKSAICFHRVEVYEGRNIPTE